MRAPLPVTDGRSSISSSFLFLFLPTYRFPCEDQSALLLPVTGGGSAIDSYSAPAAGGSASAAVHQYQLCSDMGRRAATCMRCRATPRSMTQRNQHVKVSSLLAT